MISGIESRFLPLPQYIGIMTVSEIMHASYFFLFSSVLFASFDVSSAVCAPHPPVGHLQGLGDRVHCSTRAQLDSVAVSRGGGTAVHFIVSHTGGRKITVYTYLHFGSLPLLEAYKTYISWCQVLLKLWMVTLWPCQAIAHQAPFIQNNIL